jgi:hypothetical protein
MLSSHDGVFTNRVSSQVLSARKLCGVSSLILLGRPEENQEGTVYIDEVTQSISYDSGALVVSGGVGIAGKLHINGEIKSSSLITIKNTSLGSNNGILCSTNPINNNHFNHGASSITVSLKTVSPLSCSTRDNNAIIVASNVLIDGEQIRENDLIFVDGSSGVQNIYYGIYIANYDNNNQIILTKAECANTPTKFARGTLIFVHNGATMCGCVFSNTTIGNVQSFALLFSRNGVITESSSIGTGVSVYSHKESNGIFFKSLVSSNGVSIINDDSNGSIKIGIEPELIDHNKLLNNNVGDPHSMYMLLNNARGRQEVLSDVYFSKALRANEIHTETLNADTISSNDVVVTGKIKNAPDGQNIIIEPNNGAEIIGLHEPRSDYALVTKKYIDSIITNYNNFYYGVSNDASKTNTTIFTEKCKVPLATISESKLAIITVSYSWSYSSALRSFNARLKINNSIIHNHKESPTRGDLSEKRNFSATIPVTIAPGDTAPIVLLEYASSSDQDIACISQVSIVINVR